MSHGEYKGTFDFCFSALKHADMVMVAPYASRNLIFQTRTSDHARAATRYGLSFYIFKSFEIPRKLQLQL